MENNEQEKKNCNNPFCEKGQLIYREGDEIYHGISGVNGVMILECPDCKLSNNNPLDSI